jgi:hypothetical protein
MPLRVSVRIHIFFVFFWSTFSCTFCCTMCIFIITCFFILLYAASTQRFEKEWEGVEKTLQQGYCTPWQERLCKFSFSIPWLTWFSLQWHLSCLSLDATIFSRPILCSLTNQHGFIKNNF